MRKALYRQHRPKKLSEVIGQQQITSALEKSLKTGKTSHAYLFIGPRGTGKTSVARILAHEINGFEYKLEDEHLDIIEIDAASNTGVDNIRSLRENAIIAPTYGKYKVYIIDEVHMLSRSAFNALLKTLEEPPEHVVFIMATTDAHKVPITITSRSQTYTFKLANRDTMAEHLATIAKAENIPIDTEALKIIARRSGGSFRDAISLLDQISTATSGDITCALLNDALGLPSDELTAQILTAFSAGDITCARTSLQNLTEQGIKPETIAEDLMETIIANPKPQLMPLLAQLLEVPTSPRPEVKLLLALLSSPSPQSNEIAPEIITKPTIKQESAPAAPTIKPQPEPTAKLQPAPNNPAQEPPHTWQDLLNTVKKDQPALHSLLIRTTAKLDQNTLNISIKNKMVKNKIEQKISYLASLLPENTEITITDQPLVADPILDNLSSIFGSVEEVELEHGR